MTDQAILDAVPTEVIQSLLSADRVVALCAFRYALGRCFNELIHVASWMVKNVEAFAASDRVIVVAEIDHESRPGAGMLPVEREIWAAVRKAFDEGRP